MAGLLLAMGLSVSALAEEKPNFVFILVDDLGFMDIGANNPNSFYETPNVDRLAAQGMRFTEGYAANPVCSPTRFSIMTGRYPTRADATNYFSGRRAGRFNPAPLNDRMPLKEVTMAEGLKSNGYKTAFLGKWHLGPTEEFWPSAQGFDVNMGGFQRGQPPAGYFSPYKNPRLTDGPKGEFLTKRLTDESLKILDDFAGDPFLMYFAFYTVHTPLQAPKALVEKYRKKAMDLEHGDEFGPEEQVLPVKAKRKVRLVQKHAVYAAMVESMDTAVGRVLDKLEELGIADNTVVCFFSDNGGLSTSEGSPTSNLPLRGGKGWLYEGGIREPMIIKWPGQTKPGSTYHKPVISCDFLPTVFDIAGVDTQKVIPKDQELDGVSLVPILKGNDLEDRTLFWHYPHYANQGGFPGGAARHGNFKLVERYEDGRVHLYNIKDDIGERNDIADQHPEVVKRLRSELHAWYKTVDAKFLQPKDGNEPWKP